MPSAIKLDRENPQVAQYFRGLLAMVVTCPACGTRFELDERLIRQESAQVRCSRCQHTFSVRRPAPRPAEPVTPAPPAPVAEGATAGQAPEPAPMPPPAAAPQTAAPAGPEPEPPTPLPPWPEVAPAPRAPRRRWPYVVAAAVLLAAGAGAAGWRHADRLTGLLPRATVTPPATTVAVKPPPPPLTPAELQDLRVELGEARFGRLENPKGGKLLVLTGEVINQGQVPRGPVRLRAALMDARHRETAHRLAYAGSTFSDQDLTTLPPEEIERWLNTIGGKSGAAALAPQARQPFTVVFFGVPADLAEAGYGFTLAVVEAPPAAQP